jgi:3-hydroxyisobutyrate dehydrogenase-like beta-hydroxyacid dehydrogenase
MTKLAFLGLGQMGAPMAGRVLEAGHDLTVWNRSQEKADTLVARGARRATSPREAGRGADAAFTMLADPQALDEVLFGEDGLVGALGGGATVVEMSTVGPEAVRRVAERLPSGVNLVDAPVLGSIPQATDGTLSIFVGGTPEQFRSLRGLLEAMGRPRRVGPLGAGAAMKLVANSTLGALMTGLGEALALADGLGLDQGDVLDVLAGSAIGVTAKGKRPLIESGRYDPNFKLALARKDLGLVEEAAAGAGVELRVAPASSRWLTDAKRAGLGDLDYSAVVAHIRGQKGT